MYIVDGRVVYSDVVRGDLRSPRCYRLHCELLLTKVKYPEGGQAMARYSYM
jgi:hypothetical protein